MHDALFDVSGLGLQPFTVPAVAEVELVAEKLRTLVQRAQPRDLFDLHLYLVDSGWHMNPADLRHAVDAKLAITRHKRWRPGLWRLNLGAIEATWESTMAAWIDPERLPAFDQVVAQVAQRLRSLRLDSTLATARATGCDARAALTAYSGGPHPRAVLGGDNGVSCGLPGGDPEHDRVSCPCSSQ